MNKDLVEIVLLSLVVGPIIAFFVLSIFIGFDNLIEILKHWNNGKRD